MTTKIIMNSKFHYVPNFLDDNEIKEYFTYLEETDDFIGNPKYTGGVSRMQKWFHKDMKYFCPKWKGEYEHWKSFEMDNTINKIIDMVQQYIDRDYKMKINSCLINKYIDGDSFISPHRDSVESFGLNPTIVILSLGQTRSIHFDSTTSKDKFSFPLESGSIFIMSGDSQESFRHSIKKEDCNGVRYSLTFREFIL